MSRLTTSKASYFFCIQLQTNLIARNHTSSTTARLQDDSHPEDTKRPAQSSPRSRTTQSSSRPQMQAGNRRMFGHLMKSLGSFQQESLSSQRTGRETKRREIEARIEERQRMVDQEVFSRKSTSGGQPYSKRRDSFRSINSSTRGRWNGDDTDWRRRNSRSPAGFHSESDSGEKRRYRDRSMSIGADKELSSGTVVEISTRDREAKPSLELQKKFGIFKQQAAYLKTNSYPPILYLPHILSVKEKSIIHDQQKDADELLESCSKALSVG